MKIDVLATVMSPNAIRAPMGGETAALVHIEGIAGGEVVGTAILGDLLRLRWDDGEIEIVARRATMMFTTRFDEPTPLGDPVPAELVPLLQRGATGVRERLVRSGDRLRVRAEVERYRWPDAVAPRFVVRDDVAAVRLDEVLVFN